MAESGPTQPPKVGDRVEVTTIPHTVGTVEKVVYGYRTAVLRLPAGGTLSATWRELRTLPDAT